MTGRRLYDAEKSRCTHPGEVRGAKASKFLGFSNFISRRSSQDVETPQESPKPVNEGHLKNGEREFWLKKTADDVVRVSYEPSQPEHRPTLHEIRQQFGTRLR
jgi:hypothetical protein